MTLTYFTCESARGTPAEVKFSFFLPQFHDSDLFHLFYRVRGAVHPLLQQRRPEQPFHAIPGRCAKTAHGRRDFGEGFSFIHRQFLYVS